MKLNPEGGSVAGLSRRKRLLFGMLSAGIAVLFAVLAIEVVLRVVLYRQARLFDDLRTEMVQQTLGEDLALIQLLAPSPVEEQVFKMRPNLDGRFVGKQVQTNSRGFRGHGDQLIVPDFFSYPSSGTNRASAGTRL